MTHQLLHFLIYLWVQLIFRQLVVNMYEIITETVIFIFVQLKQIQKYFKTKLKKNLTNTNVKTSKISRTNKYG